MIDRIDLFVTLLGVGYGGVLIWAFFVSNAFTEAMRIDALLFPNASASTRPVNLVLGVLVAGYCAYSLLAG